MLTGLGSLIWSGLNILFVFQNGATPLIIAARDGNKEICQLLIDHGASTTQLDKVKSLLLFLWYPQKRTHTKLYSETDCFAQDHHSVLVDVLLLNHEGTQDLLQNRKEFVKSIDVDIDTMPATPPLFAQGRQAVEAFIICWFHTMIGVLSDTLLHQNNNHLIGGHMHLAVGGCTYIVFYICIVLFRQLPCRSNGCCA